MTIHLDLTEEELRSSFDGVEAGEISAQEAFESTMLFQSKNKVIR